MFAVDTNILVYAANANAPEHPRCSERLAAWIAQPGPWYTTWSVLYEFLRVATHPRVHARPLATAEAWRFVEALLASPSLCILDHTPRHAAVAAQTLAEVPGLRGNLLHDAHIAALMREHGISRIYTRDGDFHRFPFLTVLDPLADD